MKKLFTDAELKELWDEFGDVPMNPETECIDTPWFIFSSGAYREDIWYWFDERYSTGVAGLMGQI